MAHKSNVFEMKTK